MKRKIVLIVVFAFISFNLFAQKEITFTVEAIERATTPIEIESFKNIVNNLSDNVEYYCPINEELVSFGTHSFLEGMHKAYAEHRPFVITPDMIWLLICQGFSNHVFYNQANLKDLLVNFEGKKQISIQNNRIVLGEKDSPWEEVFPDFSEQIGNYVGNDLLSTLSADFSTTTLNETIASQITLMDAMEPFFEYKLYKAICGIPEITLKGTPDDWKKVISKTKHLSKYELDWWTKRIVPVLEEIYKTSKGKINKRFWREMFKIHTIDDYGEPKTIDGWILNFFPYDKNGNRLDFKNVIRLEVEDILNDLPNEIATVNFVYELRDESGNLLSTYPMEFWAGFVGLKQNNQSLSLEPKIGWFVAHKSMIKEQFVSKEWESAVYNRVEQIPDEIMAMDNIWDLTINFVNSINFPEKFGTTKIQRLNLNGRITEEEIARIKKMLPETVLFINEKFIE